jgi:hypothetical protein
LSFVNSSEHCLCDGDDDDDDDDDDDEEEEEEDDEGQDKDLRGNPCIR